jgi:shikimate kinase
VIDELTAMPGTILATGGGVVMDKLNRQHLASRGRVIYLHTSVDQQLQRTAHDRNRPLLQTANPKQKLEELTEIRDPLYREIADWVIETDGCRVRDVVQQIVQKIEHSR